jgi:hypothetical protein
MMAAADGQAIVDCLAQFMREQGVPIRRRLGRHFRCSIWFSLALVLLTSGCGALKAPQKMVTAVVPSSKPTQMEPLELQLQIQRFTDDAMAQTDRGLNEYASRLGTEAARVQSLRLRLASGSSLLSIASGPNPNANLLDLVSVTVLIRRTIEDYWVKREDGEAFQPWLEASCAVETNAWSLATRVLKPEQMEELRQAIDQWYTQNPEVRSAFFVRPSEVSTMLRTSKEKGGINSVFSLMSLDPTLGLDPAVREMTHTRLFAERAMFTAQRAPFSLRLHTELLGLELADQPAVRAMLTNFGRLSDSAERVSQAAQTVSQTAAQLPDRISDERKAIVAEFDAREGALRNLATDVDRALASGEKMSSSLNTTVASFDGLMKRFGVGEPSTKPAKTNSVPFNINDYAHTAEQVALMARELDGLLKDTGETVSAPMMEKQFAKLAGQARSDVKSLLDHAFLLAAGLVVLIFACAVTFRLLGRRNAATREVVATSVETTPETTLR